MVNTNQFPYSCIGYISFCHPTNVQHKYKATASVVGHSHILTSAHVIFDSSYDKKLKSRNVIFRMHQYPGVFWPMKSYFLHPEWDNGGEQICNDYCIITLNKNINGKTVYEVLKQYILIRPMSYCLGTNCVSIRCTSLIQYQNAGKTLNYYSCLNCTDCTINKTGELVTGESGGPWFCYNGTEYDKEICGITSSNLGGHISSPVFGSNLVDIINALIVTDDTA